MILISQNRLSEYEFSYAQVWQDVTGEFFVSAFIADTGVCIHFADRFGKLKHYKSLNTLASLFHALNIDRFEVKLFSEYDLTEMRSCEADRILSQYSETDGGKGA